MKKLLLACLAVLCSTVLYAQKDVTTFLGIPVDGNKSEMRQKLRAKGFKLKKLNKEKYLEGEFNGTDVKIFIGTNNNKVHRLIICDAHPRSEAGIKIRFNNLVRQFENNKRYISYDTFTIGDDEQISTEMLVNKKNFTAIFYQKPDMEKIDRLAMQTKVYQQLLEKYTEEELENPTPEIEEESQDISFHAAMDFAYMKPVWFRIYELYGKYYISMFYDNEYNHANGEDL